MIKTSYLTHLGTPSRVWAISAVHGQTPRLNAIHSAIWPHFKAGDRIVYLGNYLGHPDRDDNPDTIDTIIMFKNALMTQHEISGGDITILRGIHEEMLQKTLQLQFAKQPYDVLTWLLQQGLEGILNHYGATASEGLSACRGGIITLTRWTNDLRAKIRQRTGHEVFYNGLKRAAFTHNADTDEGVLFVHAGLDTDRPLYTQKDNFWWGGKSFDAMNTPYSPFRRVVRGHDPQHKGLHIDDIKISLDDSVNRQEKLVCAMMDARGDVLDLLSI